MNGVSPATFNGITQADALFGHCFHGNIYPRINNQQALRAKLMIFPEYSTRLVENALAVTRWPMHDSMANRIGKQEMQFYVHKKLGI